MRFNSRGETHGGRVGIGSWFTDQKWLTQAEVGSAWLACGGGVWIDSTGMARSNIDYQYPAGLIAKVWDISLDGSVCEVPNYHAPYSCGVWPHRDVYEKFNNFVMYARAINGGHFVALVGARRVFSSRHGWIELPAGIQAFQIALAGDVLLFTTQLHLALLNIKTGLGLCVMPTQWYPDLFEQASGVLVGCDADADGNGTFTVPVAFSTLTQDLSDLTDNPDIDPVEAPKITITSFDTTGTAPFDCHARAELSGGPAEIITWLENGFTDAVYPANVLDHVFHFENPGSYKIAVRVSGPGGQDETARERIVTVTAKPSSGGVFVQTIQLSEPSYLNWRYGGGQSLEPPTAPDDPNRDPFEHGRPSAGADETAKLFRFGDGTYGVQSPNGRSWLSIQPDGSYEERPVEDSEPGAYERFTLQGNVLTSVSAPDVQMVHP